MNIVEFGIERIKIYLKRGFLVRVKEYAYIISISIRVKEYMLMS